MKKKKMAELEKCYSIAPLEYQGKRHILVAAEKMDRCILFDAEGHEEQTVWKGPGGVMSMVQVPGTNGQFLATQKFYSPNDSKEAKIVIVTPNESGKWEIRTLLQLPFVHRFDILKSDKKNYLIACTLKSAHEYKDDWRFAGKVYAAELPENLQCFDEDHPLKLEVIKDNMLRNHGYYKEQIEGREASLISCENGIFLFFPPEEGNSWQIQRLLDVPASDACMIDLDKDGEKELIVISPFHGSHIKIYKKEKGEFREIYEYPEEAEFLHAIWRGMLQGRPTAVLGYRMGARKLLAFTWDNDEEKIKVEEIDSGAGPANVLGYHYKGKDVLIAANREVDEVDMYIYEDKIGGAGYEQN